MIGSSLPPDRHTRAQGWLPWLALFLGLCLVGALMVVVGALNHGLTNDVGVSPYHIPLFLWLAAVTGLSIFLVVRAVRRGQGWMHAYPAGYGSLGAGLVVMLAYLVIDVGWREGVGIKPSGIETGFAPSRVIVGVGVFLVLVTPLRARLQDGNGGAWPAVFSVALLAALVQPGGFHPAENPWMEYVRADPSGEVWVMNADGSDQTRLLTSSDPYLTWTPAWSPDGREIAYSLVHAGAHSPADDTADIWIVEADGSHARPVARGNSYKWLPHWSPDGTFIVYTDEPQGGPWGTTATPAAGVGGFLGPGFFPGQPTQVREPAHIWRVRADGRGEPEQITNADANDRAATYSPDGTTLAFDSLRDGVTRVYVMNADGSNPRRLTDGAADFGATWSPDGRYLAYNAPGPQLSDSQIFVVVVDGTGRPRQLTSDPGSHLYPTWSPDGSRIAFGLSRDNRGSIWSIAVDGSDLRELSRDPRADVGLTSGGGAWGKDGRIVYGRGLGPPVSADPLVRDDLGSAAMLLVAVLLSLAAVVIRVSPPFGTFALILGISTALIAGQGDEWRFIPASVVGGLIVDLLVRYAPPDRKAQVAGASLASAVVLGSGATVVLTTGLGWSPTLLLGVAFAAAAVGYVLGGFAGAARPSIERSTAA
jgi:Tol biopolymer transport system component